MIDHVLLYFLLLMNYAADGISDAILWSRKGANAFKGNEHEMLVLERALFIIACIYSAMYIQHGNELFDLIFVISASIFIFPFIHNGVYYTVRNVIDENVYPNKFFSEPSSSSTARLNFSFTFRVILGVLSIIAMIIFMLVDLL